MGKDSRTQSSREKGLRNLGLRIRKGSSSSRKKSLRKLGDRAHEDVTTTESSDEDDLTDSSSSGDFNDNIKYQDFKKTIRKAFHKVSKSRLDGNNKAHAKILDSVKKMFKTVDEWGNREIRNSVFKREFPYILKEMDECKGLTKKADFKENLSLLINDIDTDHDDFITMAEFVAFYLYESSELRHIVKRLSKEINKKGSNDLAYIRKWKTIFNNDKNFTKANLELLFEEVVEVSLTSTELDLVWQNISQKKKNTTYVKASQVKRFFKNGLGANLHWVEQDHETPIYDIQVSSNREQENAFDKAGYTPLGSQRLNQGKFNDVQIWYTHKKKDFHHPIIDVKLYPLKESTALFADGYTCVQTSINTGFLGFSTILGQEHRLMYLWIRRGAGGTDNKYAVTNMHLASGLLSDHDNILNEIPCGGYEKVRGNMTQDKDKGTFLFILRRDVAPELSDVSHTTKLYSAHQNLESGSKNPRANAKRIEKEKIDDSRQSVELYQKIYHRIRLDIRQKFTKSSEDLDIVQNLFQKYAKDHPEKGWSRAEFRNVMKVLNVHVPKKIWDELNLLLDYSNTGFVNQHDLRDFVALRPNELDSFADEIRLGVIENSDKGDTLDDSIKKVFKHYANEGKSLSSEDFTLFVKDYIPDILSDTEIKRLMLYFDHSGDGKVKIKEFEYFFKNCDSVLQAMSSTRVLHSAKFLLSYMQSEYGQRMVVNNGNWEKSAIDMWHRFDTHKTLDGLIRVHELDKVIKQASSQLHQGVSFFLSYDELVSLIEFIQPSGRVKKTATINYKAFCNFFGFGKGDENFLTEIRVTHGTDDDALEEENLAISHFRADSGYVRKGFNEHEVYVTKLWVKYGKSSRSQPFIRQIQTGPINCSLKKREGWKIIKPYLYKNRSRQRIFLWVSSDADSASTSDKGIKHIKLQEEKPSTVYDYNSGLSQRYNRCKKTTKADEKSPLWVLTCRPLQVRGFAIQKRASVKLTSPIEVSDKILVYSNSTQKWENAIVERINNINDREYSYDIMFNDDHTRLSNVPGKWVKRSYHMMRSNNEFESSRNLRHTKRGSSNMYSEKLEEIRSYLKKQAKMRYKKTKVHHGKMGHDVKGFFERHLDDYSEGSVTLKRFHRFLDDCGIVHNSHVDDVELLREIDCNGDNKIDVQDLITFIFEGDPDAILEHQNYDNTSNVEYSDGEYFNEHLPMTSNKVINKLIKKIKLKVKRRGLSIFKSKKHKAKNGAIAIRYMKQTVEDMFQGKPIKSSDFLALVKKTKSLNADGDIIFKKFMSYFSKNGFDSDASSNSEKDSLYNDSDDDDESDVSLSETSDNEYMSCSDFDTKIVARPSRKLRKNREKYNGNKINRRNQDGMWQLYKGIVKSRIEDPHDQIDSWIRKLARTINRTGVSERKKEKRFMKILRHNVGLTKILSRKIISSIQVKNAGNKKTISLGKLKNQLVGMTVKKASSSNHLFTDDDRNTIEKITSAMKRTSLSIDTVTKTFEEYDINYDDTVSLKDFRVISGNLGFNLNMQEIRKLLDEFENNDRIDYRRLLNYVMSNGDNMKNKMGLGEIEKVVQKTKRLLKESENVRGDRHGNKVLKSFEYYDLSGTGVISKEQFQSCLEKLGIILDAGEVNLLLNHFSYGGNIAHGIDYRMFSNSLQDNNVNIDLIQQKIKRDLFSTINNGVGYFDVFSSCDHNGDGKVTRLNFRKSLKKLNIKLQEDELRQMMDKFDSAGNGHVDYGAFYRWVAPFGSKASVDVEALQSRLQHLIRESAMMRPSTFDMRDAFSNFDHGNTGLVSRNQFSRSLKDMNLSLSKGELSYLMDRFGRQGHNVNYQTFANFAKCNENEMDTISLRLQSRFDDIAREGIDYREVFEMFDERGTGFITRNEFKEAARQLGLPLTSTQLFALMERFSHFAGGDKISYHDILEFVGFRHKKLSRTSIVAVVQHPRNRETINGSGHDGFQYTRRDQETKNESNNHLLHADSLFPPRTVEKWLDRKATDKQREAFSEIFSAIHQYDKVSSYLGDAIVDHTTNTVSRFVSHLPYELAGTKTSTLSRRRKNQKNRRRPKDRDMEYSRDYSDYESYSDSDSGTRRRRLRSSSRNKSIKKRRRKSRYSHGTESDSDSDDYDDRRARRENSSRRAKDRKASSPRNRRKNNGSGYDDTSDSEGTSNYGRHRYNSRARIDSSDSRRNSRGRRSKYSSDYSD
eukprot:g87.t1